MTRNEDPNPLPEEMPCGEKGYLGRCTGMYHINASGVNYTCDACGQVVDYDIMKDGGLFVTIMLDQFPELSAADLLDILDEDDEDESCPYGE